MFRPNVQHLQMPMFSSIDSMPAKVIERLESSWAETFYDQVFLRIDESLFSGLYSNEPSRPNIPINVLVGLETLKSGFGWTDEEMYDHFCFDVQVRYALGCRDLSEGYFALRTIYNFRDRVTRHMQETGENLIEKAFEQVTDEQMEAFALKTGKLRMDSTQVASNIREMSRLQLLVEVLQRVHRMLKEEDQARYADVFAPYLQGTSGQYTYRLKSSEIDEHLQRIGELMDKLIGELPAPYAEEETYQLLQRVFREHFTVESDAEGPPSPPGNPSAQTSLRLRPKAGEELSASSLQSPDDPQATYRQKRGEDYIGYVANLSETCDPENDFQLIVKVQTESNNTDDAAMLAQALPELVERTDVEQMHTDGGYNSPKVDDAMRQHHVEQIQTAIRGQKPSSDKLGLADFDWQTDAEGRPEALTCPHGQHANVGPGRKAHRFRASVPKAACETCPLSERCPTTPLKRTPERVLRFSQHEVDLALRRQRCDQARASGQNLRAAVEATVRSVKHPFGNGKVPVRGKPRVSMVVVASALMSNLRRIHRYLVNQNQPNEREKATEKQSDTAYQQSALSFLSLFQTIFRPIFRFQPAWAGQF
jgi:hypothetical protein